MSRVAVRRILTVLAAALLAGADDCGDGAEYFDWPTPVRDRDKNPRALYSNLGEYRSPADGPAWLNHGATDFVAPEGTDVYSPDTGQVRFGEQSDQKSGLPPVKIGRFAFLHFADADSLNVNPLVLGDETIWTWVVNPADPILVRDGGGTKETTLEDLQRSVVRGVRRDGAGGLEDVFWFSRANPIGKAGPEPDLHVLYYETAEAPYSDRRSIRNALTVLEYSNPNPPAIQLIRLYSQLAPNGRTKEFLASNERASSTGVMDIDRHGGVDVVVTCASFARNSAVRAGIYRLAYRIHRFLTDEELQEGRPEEAVRGPGRRFMIPVGDQETMWEYDDLPARGTDGNLVARNPQDTILTPPPLAYPLPGTDLVSRFNLTQQNQNKYSAYVVSNTGGDDAKHWELEDVTTFPDGEYLLTVTAWNIGQSNGIGRAPTLRDREAQVVVEVTTQNRRRTLRIKRP